ncbi:glycosyl transferase family 2 [Bifidobacterium tissieri]|uniref:Glycosyl transferase family 2 n=1 Tax=Bifidobacterium tissieri TaxID=1630162 RepID=A0A261FEC2_9BIFI|nr:glycosyltransferase [Bifidobacterium tissieri]OZG57216.1 glycosyl transferase family 2 [Bifidobacterium tissieri]
MQEQTNPQSNSQTKPLISVVVPVYKVERYLDDCLRSIVAQTYRNLEIIVVDDGSPDGCPAICDAWEKKDPRIRVIHKPNGGLSSARNAGLDVIQGDVVGFVDSDDEIEPDMYEHMIKTMHDADADVVMCGTRTMNEDGTLAEYDASSAMPSRDFTMQEAVEGFLYHRDGMTGGIWCRIYDARFFRKDGMGLRFPDGLNSEDYYMVSRIYPAMRRLAFRPNPFYRYRQRENSISHAKINKHSFDKITIADLCTKYLYQQGYLDRHALGYFVMQGYYDVLYSIVGLDPDPAQVKRCVDGLRNSARTVYTDPTVPFSRKIRLWAFAHFPKLYWRLSSARG